jgi:hypothetical protein
LNIRATRASSSIRRAFTIKQNDPALTPGQKKAQEAKLKQREEECRKMEERRCKDKVLLDTSTDPKEIGLQRNCELRLIQLNIETLQTNLQNASGRQAELNTRADQHTRDNKSVPEGLRDELSIVPTTRRLQIEQPLAKKRHNLVASGQQDDNKKERFIELTGKQ